MLLHTLKTLGLEGFNTAIEPNKDNKGNYYVFSEKEVDAIIEHSILEQAKLFMFSIGIKIDKNGSLYTYAFMSLIGMIKEKHKSFKTIMDRVKYVEPDTVIVFQQLENNTYRIVIDELYDINNTR